MKDGKPWLPDDVPPIEEAKRKLAETVLRMQKEQVNRLDAIIEKHLATPAYDEVDPNGLSPHTPGAKLDQGKNRLGLVLMDFASALMEVGKVGTYGAKKYTDHGWVTVLGAEQRYTDALFRHLLAEGNGEMKDPDTQLLHAAHAAWNALARLRFILERQQGVAPNAEATCPRQ